MDNEMQGDPMDGSVLAQFVEQTGSARYAQEFSSSPDSIRRALIGVTNYLRGRVAPDTAGSVEIVLAELCNNIGQHGYDAAGRISLQLACGQDALICTVSDQGAAVPGGFFCPVLARPAAVPAETLPVSGFGGYLIRALARQIHYRRRDGRNIVTFEIPAAG